MGYFLLVKGESNKEIVEIVGDSDLMNQYRGRFRIDGIIAVFTAIFLLSIR